jgi:ribosome biogenesis protein ENP2
LIHRFYEVKDEAHADAFRNKVSLAKEHSLPLEKRVSVEENNASWKVRNKFQAGGRQVSFRAESGHKDQSSKDLIKKRGIRSLGLKSNTRGRGRGKPGFKKR